MKGKMRLFSLLVLCLGLGYWWLNVQDEKQAPSAQLATPELKPEETAVPSSSTNMLGAIDIHHFELDNLLEHWKSAVRPGMENTVETLILESVRKASTPADTAKNLLHHYVEKTNPTLQERLEIVSALSFCERRAAYGETPDISERPKQLQAQYTTYCADLENTDYLTNKSIMRDLVDAGYIEARLMYHAVGPLGRQATEEEVIRTIGEDAARQWLNEATQYLVDYARNGGSRPDMAYSALAAMHGGFAEKPPPGSLFGEMFDAEKAYTYEYLRAVALIASPPPVARPEMVPRIQENSLQNLRRMEVTLTPEQISAARQRAVDILAGS